MIDIQSYDISLLTNAQCHERMLRMKRFKSIAVITFLLMFVLLTVASAYSETDPVQNVINHDFKAYQILSAKGSGDMLAEVEWGSALADASAQAAFLNALKSNDGFVEANGNIFADCDDPDSLARVLENYENNSAVAKAFACAAFDYIKSSGGASYGTFSNGDTLGEAGYYLFEDASDDSVVNPVILRMSADSKVSILVKASVPHVEKKVKEGSYNINYTSGTVTGANGSVGLNYGAGYNDAADYGIGDMIPFELIGTMPGNIGDYSSYYYSFIDTLSVGLTFDASNADVRVGLYEVSGDSYALAADVTSLFAVDVTSVTGGTQVTFTCEDILSAAFPSVTADSVIIVNYRSELNADAVIGTAGNSNKAALEYSNRPENPDSHGVTATDEVVVYTYCLRLEKIDRYDGNGLKDAKFILQNSEGKYYTLSATGSRWSDDEADATALVSDDNGMIEVKGLDEGRYTVTEIEAPDEYRLISDSFTFDINADILPDFNDADKAQQYLEIAELDSPEKAIDADSLGVVITVNPSSAASADSATAADKVAGNAVLTIRNERLYSLPGTGGSGTIYYYVGGGLLLAAGLALIAFKVKTK